MSRLTLFSVRNRALIALATLFAVLAGLWSTSALPRELFPSLQFPVLAVTTPVPGSSSSVVEEQVTEPIEIVARGLNNVVKVTSTSTDGFSSVIVELDYGSNIGAVQTDLQRAVLAQAANLPDGAEPQIFAGNLDDFPIVQLAATGGSDVDATDLVDRLERLVIPEIEDLDGVRAATLSGVADRVVTIDLDEEEAADAGASAATVAQLLQANGVVVPGGTVLDESTELPVLVGSRLTSVEQIEALPLLTPQVLGAQQAAGQQRAAAAEAQTAADDAATAAAENPTDPALAAGAAAAAAAAEQAQGALDAAGEVEVPTLGDVATVTLETREATAYTRTNGEPSVGLAITKTPDGNAVEISHALEDLQDEIGVALGGGELVTIYDQAPFIEKSIEDLATEGLLGLGFAILVVLVFLLSVRLTLVTAMSIPLSLLIALIGLQALGYSLNILTLGALTIAVGRVVDDSIVVIENIKRHIARGDERRTAVVEATREVAGAITSATVATVAVFLPLGFVGGQVGELFRPFAVTVALAMLASLLVALTIIPVLGYWFLGSGGGGRHEESGPEADDAPDRLQRAYLPVLRTAVGHPWVTVLLAALVLGGTGYAATLLKTDFIGSSGENTLQATLTMPTGTRLAETDEQAQEIEEWLAGREEVAAYQVVAGSPGGIEAVFFGSGSNTATFAMTLEEGVDGEAFGEELTSHVEEELVEGATITASAGQQMGTSELEVVVQAQDEDDLRTAAEAVTGLLQEVGAADVTNNLTDTVPSLRVSVDRAAAAEVGLTEAQIGQLVQAATDGAQVGRVEFDAQQVDVVVRQGSAEDLDALSALEVAATADGEPVTLGELAELETVEEAVTITRVDGLRAASVTGRPTGDDLGALSGEIGDRLETLDVPAGVQVELGGISADQEAAFSALGLALLAAIAIVYLVMVATFNSLVQPLILLVSVPFAATGSIGLLLITDKPLDVASMVGMLMLVGIVVTNAIVLIDLVNQYRVRGLQRTEALFEGARHRLRPIIMTALATILALTPMALAITGGGAFISQPLAIVVIGGLISSTLLTLILVPVLYELVERGASWASGLRGRRAEKKAQRASDRGDGRRSRRGSPRASSRAQPVGGPHQGGGAGGAGDAGGAAPAGA
ncbi:efflux RND transporter permease subunit [Ornithinimicrobium humiphilum]|uniref:HAE1 family hydrophobic/amphiphilic exporter-1 n=1 Tax=Ornithinimicrobium humiphilum TaxID=125288 RepID=A0A543K6Q4_9MICO|nr:efflux RND transporter permease subunit [Ornithinimicrobium humiphilum]TQM90714.1 HAE1 family hydrophobic/amphiphilic exporter-1 [Ornithinimicrobium humiphilum]